MPSLRKSLVLSFAQQYTGLLITVPAIMVLARYIGPRETGVFSVALGLTNLVHVLRDFGVGAYLIQERDLTREKLRAAFTVTAASAWAIALALFLSGPAIAAFYREPGVNDVMQVLALNFVVIPFGAPAQAVLRREMRYDALYVISTAANFLRAATSIALAVLGFSYMSLAWGSLAGVVTAAIVVAFFRPRDAWLTPGLSEWRSVFSFGTKKVAIDILTQFSANANDLVIGRMIGLAAAGLFSRGAGLINQFNSRFQGAIGGVIYPAFASYSRGGRDANMLFAKSIAYMTAVAWPFYIFAAIMAEPIILAAFGSQWLRAVPILRILAVAAAISTLNLYTHKLLMAVGHINSVVKIQLVTQPVRIGLIIVAALYSLEAVAATQVVAAAFGIVLTYRQLGKRLGVQFGHTLKATGRSAVMTLVSNVPTVLVVAAYATGQIGPWVALVVSGIGWGLGWLLGAWATKHPILGEVGAALSRFSAGRRLLKVIT